MKCFVFLQGLFITFLSFAQAPNIDLVDDAVVMVKIYDYKGGYVGHGSGFLLDSTGLVATNYHVVKDAFSLKVTIEKKGVKTDYDVEKIVSGSKEKDLAIIRIKAPQEKTLFPFLKLATSLPSKGSECWAIGTPAEPIYMNTVSKGLVSNISYNSNPLMIQTNAEITHGSSGGALINSEGEVIGITSSGDGSDDGARASINFAIYIGELKNLPEINKATIVDKTTIPAEISFYTTYKYSASIMLYIDNLYVGSFTQFFYTDSKIECGEAGTITRLLYPGTHSYNIYYSDENKWLNGTINLEAGSCQLFKVGNYQSPASKVLLNDEVKSDIIKQNNQGKNTYKDLSTVPNESVKLTFFTSKLKTFKISAPGIGICGMCSKKTPLTVVVDKNSYYKFLMEAGRTISWRNVRIGSKDMFYKL